MYEKIDKRPHHVIHQEGPCNLWLNFCGFSPGPGPVTHIGDVFRISPSATAKTFSGAGSFNTGETLYVYNHQSNTNTFDNDNLDQPLSFNV